MSQPLANFLVLLLRPQPAGPLIVPILSSQPALCILHNSHNSSADQHIQHCNSRDVQACSAANRRSFTPSGMSVQFAGYENEGRYADSMTLREPLDTPHPQCGCRHVGQSSHRELAKPRRPLIATAARSRNRQNHTHPIMLSNLCPTLSWPIFSAPSPTRSPSRARTLAPVPRGGCFLPPPPPPLKTAL